MKRFATAWSSKATAAVGAGGVTASLRAYATKRDLYEVLGVGRSSSDKEIKNAYRKKAMETHPDKGGDKDKFAEIGEAYEVLSDPQKRQMYDQYGHEAAMGMGGPGGMGGGHRSAEDIFKDFFGGGGSPFGDMFGGGGRGPQRTQTIDLKVECTLEELYSGVTKRVQVDRPCVCDTCRGEGTTVAGAKVRCTQCDGSGQEVIHHRLGGGMVQQMVSVCRKCQGQGSSIRAQDRCKKCNGEGHFVKLDEVAFTVEPGTPDNAVVVMRGEAGRMPGVEPGDLQLHLVTTPHRTYQRKGDDLVVKMQLSLSEALLGHDMKLTMLDGRKVVVRTKPGEVMQNNSVLKVPNEGMKHYQQPGRGDIYVIVTVQMPSQLSKEQEELVTKAFGAPKRDEVTPGSVVHAQRMRETVQELESRKQREWSGQAHHRGNRGSGRHGGDNQQVQCANQ